MEATGVRAAVETLIDTDVSVADHAELAVLARSVARLQSFVDTAKVQISRRTGRLAADGDRTSDHALLDEGRLSGRDVAATEGRDRICEQMPKFEDALANGDCTAGHLDALARHTRDLSDAERADLHDAAADLVDHATNEPVGLFDRTAKNLVDKIREMHRPGNDADELDRQRAASKVKRWTERDSGMKQTLISLDPLRDAALWNVIDQHLASLRHEPANADRTFAELQVEAVMASVSRSAGVPRIPEVVVHVDAATLCHGRHDDTMSETADGVDLPPSTVQRLCCEAILQAVIVQPDGTVDRVCAEQRTATRRQRRMLESMYASCAHPHCDVPFAACRAHHVVWWSHGGATTLDNLVPLCERHHHLVHEGRWNVELGPGRSLTWFRPDGAVWHTDPGPNRRSTRVRQPRQAAADRAERPPGEREPSVNGPPRPSTTEDSLGRTARSA